MLNKLTDLELVTRLKDGNTLVINELISRYSDKAFHLSLKLTKNNEDAQEVVQDVFTKVFLKINTFKQDSAFSSWFYRITVNTAFMLLRKRKKHAAVSYIDNFYNCDDSNYSFNNSKKYNYAEVCADLRSTLQEAIDNLPLNYKAIFVLKDVDGLTNKAIAKQLNITLPTVKSRLHRARIVLRKSLCKFYNEYTGNNYKINKLKKVA